MRLDYLHDIIFADGSSLFKCDWLVMDDWVGPSLLDLLNDSLVEGLLFAGLHHRERSLSKNTGVLSENDELVLEFLLLLIQSLVIRFELGCLALEAVSLLFDGRLLLVHFVHGDEVSEFDRFGSIGVYGHHLLAFTK